ncbi:MAG: hypothetical protein JXA57_07280 [Armatimonadetes bacterium]|nr:hypothetical protein [Armatimonadota bacterium]
MSFNRREMLIIFGVLGLVWALLLAGLVKWQRGGAERKASNEPELLHYPGTESIEEQTSINLGFRKYWFVLHEDYPSESVYLWYKNELEQQGWRPAVPGQPQWRRHVSGNEAKDMFQAMWISPDNLFQYEVELLSIARPADEHNPLMGERRDEGIQVFVTLRRALHPGIIMQPRAPEQRGGGIEVGR